MPSFSSLRSPSFSSSSRHILIQRPLFYSPSSNPSSPSFPSSIHTCTSHASHHHQVGSFFNWLSAILSGSALGALFWLSTPYIDSHLLNTSLSYADSPTPTTHGDSNANAKAGWHKTRALLRKLSLPESTHHLIFGGYIVIVLLWIKFCSFGCFCLCLFSHSFETCFLQMLIEERFSSTMRNAFVSEVLLRRYFHLLYCHFIISCLLSTS